MEIVDSLFEHLMNAIVIWTKRQESKNKKQSIQEFCLTWDGKNRRREKNARNFVSPRNRFIINDSNINIQENRIG